MRIKGKKHGKVAQFYSTSHRRCEHGGGGGGGGGGGRGCAFPNLMGGLSQYMEGAWGGGGLKCCRKIPVEEFI